MAIKNQIQLITYPDSLGGNLKTLSQLCSRHLAEIFKGGVHILPPYPSSADRGFAPVTYFEIEPGLGTWQDVRALGEQTDVVLDLMVNHISRQSAYFQDFVKCGRRSEYADLFITLDKIWPDGTPPDEDVAKIFLRKPDNPFSEITIIDTGEREKVWTSFGTRDWSEQVDLDVRSESTRQFFRDVLSHMSQNGAKVVRLDAIGYVIKKAGTNCFFVEPEIYGFMDWIKAEANQQGLELLPELHAHYSIQNKLVEHGYWVYDFILPGLVLQTLINRSTTRLKEHLRVCPRKQFTMLDCHDGIPIQPDLDDVIHIDEAQALVQTCLQRGANLNRILSSEHKRRADFDVHQINCTYYSALDENDDAYIAARAIQFFAPGVPQVYYVGLLAGRNDQNEVLRTSEGRAVNRHNYTVDEVELELRRPVVRRLIELIRFRNEYEAFNGEFEVLASDDNSLRVSWWNGPAECVLTVDLADGSAVIRYVDKKGIWTEYAP